MLKKFAALVTGAVLLVGSSLSLAFSGPYIGVDVGGNVGSWPVKDNYGKTVNFGSHGVIGTLFAGYGYEVDHFYLGLDAFFNQASNRSSTKTIDNGTVQRYISQKYGYGVSLLPGIAITDGALVYLRLGVVRTNFQVSDTSLTLPMPRSSTNITGAQVGLGGQIALTVSLDARAEYVYSKYNSNSNGNGKFSPHNNQANLGLVYKFG